jgi:hypothetical protein
LRAVDGFLRRQGLAEPVAQRLALQKLRDDVRASFAQPDVMDDENVGVIGLGSGAGFWLPYPE